MNEILDFLSFFVYSPWKISISLFYLPFQFNIFQFNMSIEHTSTYHRHYQRHLLKAHEVWKKTLSNQNRASTFLTCVFSFKMMLPLRRIRMFDLENELRRSQITNYESRSQLLLDFRREGTNAAIPLAFHAWKLTTAESVHSFYETLSKAVRTFIQISSFSLVFFSIFYIVRLYSFFIRIFFGK